MGIEKAMVVGAGTMGAGIAQVFAQNGIPVVLTDLNEEMVAKAIGGLEARVARRVEQGKISAEAKDAIFSRITPGTGYAKAADADIVVEAVFEDMDIKKEVLGALDEAAPERAIFASNTTSLSITEMAGATSRPEMVVGVHFFNPPLVMKLVEIMPGSRHLERDGGGGAHTRRAARQDARDGEFRQPGGHRQPRAGGDAQTRRWKSMRAVSLPPRTSTRR